MCEFFSAILTKDSVIYNANTDSHEDLLEKSGLKDTDREPDFVRVELLPRDKDIFNQKSTNWYLKTDQDIFPAWFNRKEAEKRTKEALATVWQERFIVDNLEWQIRRDQRLFVNNSKVKVFDSREKTSSRLPIRLLRFPATLAALTTAFPQSLPLLPYMYRNSSIFSGNSFAILYGNSSGLFCSNASGELHDNSSVVLCDNSLAILYDNSKAVLFDNSSAVILSKNAQVEDNSNGSAYIKDLTEDPNWTENLSWNLDPKGVQRIAYRLSMILREQERQARDTINYYESQLCDERRILAYYEKQINQR
ncbi:MAG: hypothetical protein AB1611_03905 [bacterium]